MVYDFGLRLKELREKKNLTQEQVATRLNLSKQSISGYENNIASPSLEIIRKLALLYGTSTDYLMGLEDRQMLSLDGLTASQKELMQDLLQEFKKK